MQERELREYMKSYLDDFIQQYTAKHPTDKFIVSEAFWSTRSSINSLSEEEIQNIMRQNNIPAKCIVLDILQNEAGNRISSDKSSDAFYRLHLTAIDEKMDLGAMNAEQYFRCKIIAEYLLNGGDPNNSIAISQFARQRSAELNNAAVKEHQKSARLLYLICAGLLIAFVCIGVAVSSEPPTDQAQISDTELTPIPISNGQIVDSPIEEALAPLAVSTCGKHSYYVVLKPIGSSGSPMSFFVRGDCDTEVDVPLGEYEIYYATGENWYGKADLFGYDTAYYKCDGTFRFYDDGKYYQGWTLELYTQSDGNLSTEYISAADFPG